MARFQTPMRFVIPTLLLVFSAPSLAAESSPATDPAAAKIEAAQKAIANHPDDPQAHLALAAALCRKARDSENIGFYNRAASAYTIVGRPIVAAAGYQPAFLHVETKLALPVSRLL